MNTIDIDSEGGAEMKFAAVLQDWHEASSYFSNEATDRPCGLMDKAPDFGSGDCRFESCQGRPTFFLPLKQLQVYKCQTMFWSSQQMSIWYAR